MVGPTACRSYSSDAAMPKLPPPPRIAQKRSGFSSAAARTTRPSASTISAARRLSRARPYFGISQPSPPPSVRPAMPVLPTTPPVVASPCSCASRVSSFQSTPPPAANRQAGKPRAPDAPSGRDEPVQLRLAVELFPEHTALRPHRAFAHVHVNPLHRRQVDHETALDGRPAGNVVTSPAHGHAETQRASQPHRVGDVGHPVTARDGARKPVAQPVVHAPAVVVPGVAGLEQLTGEGLICERKGFGYRRHGSTSGGSDPAW